MAELRIGHHPEETSTQYFEDMAWIRANKRQLVAEYGDCYIVVHRQQVLGTGSSLIEAFADANKNLSPELDGINPAYDFVTLKRDIMGMIRRIRS